MRRDPRKAGRVIRPSCRSDSSEREREGRKRGSSGSILDHRAVLREVQGGDWAETVCQRDTAFPRIGPAEVFLQHSPGSSPWEGGLSTNVERDSEHTQGRWLIRLSAVRELGGQFSHPSYEVINPKSHKLFICSHLISYQQRIEGQGSLILTEM